MNSTSKVQNEDVGVPPFTQRMFSQNADDRAKAIELAEELCRQTKTTFFVTGTSEVPMDKGIAVANHLVYPCLIHTATPPQTAINATGCSNEPYRPATHAGQSDPNASKTLPFMTAVGGHVLIHVANSGAVLPDAWTGLCVEASDENAFWYVGHEDGERSFTRLKARTVEAARVELATRVLTSKALADLYPVKGSMPAELVDQLYSKREEEVARLAAQAVITVSDLSGLDRGARFAVADKLFARCNDEAKYALLHDNHPHVRSAATIAEGSTNHSCS